MLIALQEVRSRLCTQQGEKEAEVVLNYSPSYYQATSALTSEISSDVASRETPRRLYGSRSLIRGKLSPKPPPPAAPGSANVHVAANLTLRLRHLREPEPAPAPAAAATATQLLVAGLRITLLLPLGVFDAAVNASVMDPRPPTESIVVAADMYISLLCTQRQEDEEGGDGDDGGGAILRQEDIKTPDQYNSLSWRGKQVTKSITLSIQVSPLSPPFPPPKSQNAIEGHVSEFVLFAVDCEHDGRGAPLPFFSTHVI